MGSERNQRDMMKGLFWCWEQKKKKKKKGGPCLFWFVRLLFAVAATLGPNRVMAVATKNEKPARGLWAFRRQEMVFR